MTVAGFTAICLATGAIVALRSVSDDPSRAHSQLNLAPDAVERKLLPQPLEAKEANAVRRATVERKLLPQPLEAVSLTLGRRTSVPTLAALSGDRIAVGMSSVVALLDATSKQELKRLPVFPSPHVVEGFLQPFDIARNGELLATVYRGVKVYDEADGKERALDSSGARIRWVMFGKDAEALIGIGDSRVNVWRVSDGALRSSLSVPRGLLVVGISPDGSLVATVKSTSSLTFSDTKLRIWDSIGGKETHTIDTPFAAGVARAVFTPDNRLVVCAGYRTDAAPAETAKKSAERLESDVPSGLQRGRVKVISSAASLIAEKPLVYDLTNGLSHLTLPATGDQLSVSSDGRTVAVSNRGQVVFCDLSSGLEFAALNAEDPLLCARFEDRGNRVVVVTAYNRVAVYDLSGIQR